MPSCKHCIHGVKDDRHVTYIRCTNKKAAVDMLAHMAVWERQRGWYVEEEYGECCRHYDGVDRGPRVPEEDWYDD